MMDDNDVCPLCCEELDMSDRQFFPCKCGYQVCMWCWHRIRESESGLCPACRTPYGDDPHEFSAVDMQEVVKANKEKAAAEKRERERLKQSQMGSSAPSSASSVGSSSSYGMPGSGHIRSSSEGLPTDGDASALVNASNIGRQLDPPKDRNQLANMRVIRRNLVYAVGLPPSIATEETLRKPEYFGQYGKISKIVLNRNHNGNGDPRRASASAYVTFAHKEDTLACILALDGFYLDGRNIRASYGTSKYCSAFIKNVRCNNPDCTYLHCMGDAEDTFTKQEIQAGYVTSGRDVLARQQQMAQQHSAATGTGSTRRRVGGGGPSSTGRVPSSPVFPPPCFDEAAKPERSRSIGEFPTSHSNISRSSSFGTTPAGFSSVAAAGVTIPAVSNNAPQQIKIRSSSVSSQPPSSTSKGASQQQRGGSAPKGTVIASSKSTTTASSSSTSSGQTPTVASVVAGGIAASSSGQPIQPPPLTTLTPLKRGNSLPATTKDKPLTNKNTANLSGTPTSGNNSRSSSPPSDSAFTISNLGDDIQLLQNMPVPQGLSEHQRSVLLEQRREAIAQMAKQQRDVAFPLPMNSSQSGSVGAPVGGAIGAVGSTSNGAKILAPGYTGEGGNTIGGSFLVGGVSGNPIASPNDRGIIGGPMLASSGLPGLGLEGAVGSIGGNTNSFNFGSIGAPAQTGSIGFEGYNNPNNNFLGQAASISRGSSNVSSSSFNEGSYPYQQDSQRKTDKWGNAEAAPSPFAGNSLFGGGSLGISGVGIWGSGSAGDPGTGSSLLSNSEGASQSGFMNNNAIRAPGGAGMRSTIGSNANYASNNVIGGSSLLGKDPFSNDSGSSALASMLGIDLPTGSGTLRETVSNNVPQPPFAPASFSNPGNYRPDSLWESSQRNATDGGNPMHTNNFPRSNQGVIGSNPSRNTNAGAVGGVAIGGGRSNMGYNAPSNNSDIALLQSLLPGVHITSGNAHQPAAPMWGSSAPASAESHGQMHGHANNGNDQNVGNSQNGNNDAWVGVSGLFGGNQNVQNQGMPSQSSIW